eukprot:Anaeramoba_ignava/a90257_78.p1 GENE.a90257_78~~a90257_78.p1  ORF type:complete len:308 (+),score=2.22 a90257_78:83-1006(+)
MFICKNCNKKITSCPHCRQPISDRLSSFIYQLAAVVFFISLIIFLLEIKVKDQINMAMRPFKITEEANEKKKKVEAAKTPGGSVKADKPLKNNKEKEKKESKDSSSTNGAGRKADFKIGIWGMDKNKIEEKEKDPLLSVIDTPTILDYSSSLGNYAAIAQYRFSSDKLIGGNYIIFGGKIKLSSKKIKSTLVAVAEPTPSWIHRDIALYKTPRNTSLNSLATIKAFYSEIYLSLTSQFGAPENIGTVEAGEKCSQSDIVEAVIARERCVKFFWKRKRTIVELFFSCGERTPYFKISYTDRKVIGWLK